jgi:NADH-ubiquinone oxidoreductase chain 6
MLFKSKAIVKQTIQLITRNATFVTWLFIISGGLILLSFFNIFLFDKPLNFYLFGMLLKIANIFITLAHNLYNYILPASIIMLSISVILFNNPIYSLLALISVFLGMVLFLISLKVEFLAMIFLIIYIGAISILFLFVIMMFNLKTLEHVAKPKSFYFSTHIYLLLIAPKFYYIVCHNLNKYINEATYFFHERLESIEYEPNNFLIYNFTHQDIWIFGYFLYTGESPLFILLGFILLTAMVGAIVLALSTIEKNY